MNYRYIQKPDGSWGHYANWKKSIAKGNLSHDSISITLFKWQNYRDGEQNSGGMGTGLSKGCNIKARSSATSVLDGGGGHTNLFLG